MSKKELLGNIFGRRSIRSYTNTPIDTETIQLLLEAGAAAPSACATDPWHFIVITTSSIQQSLADMLPNGANMIRQAPVTILVCGDLNRAHIQSESYMLQDCAAAIENILISAHQLGLGAVWMGIHPRQERMEKVHKYFNLADGIIPVSAIAVGYPAETKEPRTRLRNECVHYDKW